MQILLALLELHRDLEGPFANSHNAGYGTSKMQVKYQIHRHGLPVWLRQFPQDPLCRDLKIMVTEETNHDEQSKENGHQPG